MNSSQYVMVSIISCVLPDLHAQLKKGVGRPVSDNPKASVTLRLDADVAAWLRASGKGYQTRVNTLLRDLMELSGRV